MKNLRIQNVMSILLRALDYIDVRLVDHGQRVAYIVYKMLQLENSYSEKEKQEICLATALHDIGAYKTEEIDNMVKFESDDVWEHAIYGYLFIKNMSPLSKWAEAILYHHLDFNKHSKIKSSRLKLAGMIHMADRVDLLLPNIKNLIDVDFLCGYKKTKFSDEIVELFIEANRKFEIEKHIKDGSYLEELKNFISSMDYNEKILLDYIKMIAYSIDFRSETTVSHVITTVSISVELGKLLGLNEEELQKILLGAYLHDIGKIATPLEILEKPGSLTNEELKIMRNHIIMTENILAGRICDDILQIAYRHHEKMDGRGYPQGLTGDQLTISERIVAVADIISALTGKRSYKDSFDKETIIDILQRQSENGKLSSDVVAASIQNYDSIMKSTQEKCKVTLEMYQNIRFEFDQKLKEFGEWK